MNAIEEEIATTAGKYMGARADEIILNTPPPAPRSKTPPRVKQRAADADKQKRRALIKATGIRQFKKMYREAQA